MPDSLSSTELEGRLNRIRAAVLSDPVFRERCAKALLDFMLRETDPGDEGVVEGFVPVAETGRCAACGQERSDAPDSVSSTDGAGRTWTIWRCDNCGDFPEVELGEVCEFCCEGVQREVEVVEVSALQDQRERTRVLEKALRAYAKWENFGDVAREALAAVAVERRGCW